MEIKTDRLVLRSFSHDEAHDLYALGNHWEIARWLANFPYPYAENDASEWIALVQNRHADGNPMSFAVALKDGNRLIGGCGLDGKKGIGIQDYSLGYWLGLPYRGKGYGVEAIKALIDYGFSGLRAEAISAHTDPENAPSQNLLLKCGLKRQGEIKLKIPTRNGNALICPFFRITKEEYEKKI